MSILRTHNLQNPDSSSINIVMDQGGNTNIAGVTTVGSNFHVTSGSVGIGTDNPLVKTHVVGASSGGGKLFIDTIGTFSGTDTSTLGFSIFRGGSNVRSNSQAEVECVGDGNYSGSLVFKIQNPGTYPNSLVERLRIKSDGKVGIGTDDPDQTLHLYDSTAFASFTNNADTGESGILFRRHDNNQNRGKVTYSFTDDALLFRASSDGSGEDLRITSAGHLLHGVTADEDTSGSGGLRFINSGDIQIDGDQKALVFRSTNNTAQTQSGIEWWNENGAGIQAKILVDRTAVSQAPSDLVFYTSANVDTAANNSEGDITERLRITSGGQLNLAGNMQFTAANPELEFNNGGPRFRVPAANTLTIHTGGGLGATTNERLRINSTGKVGIGYDNPSYMLEVHNPNPGNDSKQLIQRWVSNSQNTLELHMYGGSVDQVQFATTNAEQTLSFLTGVATGNVNSTQTSLLLTQNRDAWFQGANASNYGGGLFIGHEASPYLSLCALRDSNRRPLIYMGGAYPEITLAHTVASNTNHGPTIRFATYVQSTNTATGNQFVIGTNGSGTFLDIGHATAGQNVNVHSGIANYNGTYRFRVTTSGCNVNGTFSVSSTKNFKIPHPLSTKTETHDLVHSSIEGPQADLIYRGVVDLVDGTATVNIDTAGRMTEGTFEVLCTNVSCFTSNETDWTAVKGSVSGNILTITAQDNTSTATVSWMVVGERKDQSMIDSPATDDNGRLITEPLKSS